MTLHMNTMTTKDGEYWAINIILLHYTQKDVGGWLASDSRRRVITIFLDCFQKYPTTGFRF